MAFPLAPSVVLIIHSTGLESFQFRNNLPELLRAFKSSAALAYLVAKALKAKVNLLSTLGI